MSMDGSNLEDNGSPQSSLCSDEAKQKSDPEVSVAAEREISSSRERRASPRKGIQLNRLLSVTLVRGDKEQLVYLHLVDLSTGGMRVNSDIKFPEEGVFNLRLGLDVFGSDLADEYGMVVFPVSVVWQKELLGGMWVCGLKFVDLPAKAREVVDKILARCSPEGRRLRFRLNRVLGVGIARKGEDVHWVYPLALDLSVEGMKIRLDEELEVGTVLPLKIFFEFDLPTIATEAEVMWVERLASGRFQVGLKFVGLDEEQALVVKRYIDRCLEEEMGAGRS